MDFVVLLQLIWNSEWTFAGVLWNGNFQRGFRDVIEVNGFLTAIFLGKKKGGLWAHKLGFMCPTCDPVSNSISVCDDSPTPSVPPVWDKGIQEGQRNENSGGKEEPSSPFPHPKMYFLTSGWVSRAARSNPLHLPGCLPKAVVVSQCPWDAGPHSQGSMSGLSSSGSHLRWSPLSHLTWCQMSLWCLLPPAYRFFSFAVVTAIPFCHAGSFGFGLFFFLCLFQMNNFDSKMLW